MKEPTNNKQNNSMRFSNFHHYSHVDEK